MAAWGHQAYLDKAVSRVERFTDETGLELTIDTRVFAEMLISALDGVVASWLSHRNTSTAVENLDNFATLFATLTRPRQARSTP